MKNITYKLSILILTSFLILGLFTVLKETKSFSDMERRPLAQAPKLNLNHFYDGAYQSDFARYLADQIPGRNFWLQLKSTTQAYSGVKDNGRVYFAQEDFLIEKNGPLDQSKLEENVGDMKHFLNKNPELKATIILAPTQAGVYEEYLPAGHSESDQEEVFETLGVPSRLQKMSEEGLYYRTDHHWTQDGAYQAYHDWLEKSGRASADPVYTKTLVTEAFYGTTYAKAPLWSVSPDSIYAYTHPTINQAEVLDHNGQLIQTGLYNPSALDSYDPYEYFIGKNVGVLEINTHSDGNGHLLLFKDSYANAFVPFLLPHFSTITMVDLRYYNGGMGELLARKEFTDVLFLYNLVTLSSESNTYKLMMD